MKRYLSLVLFLLCMLLPFSRAEDMPPKRMTLMIYMCGTNLESEYGSASDDILEMLDAGVDSSQVNVMLMTGGSRFWQLGMDPDCTTISEIIRSSHLRTLVPDTLMNMGDPATLTHFIRYCMQEKPAESYALILWDHGAGPLGGICMDELNAYDRLSMPELTEALDNALNGNRLSWIGFDACLMSTAEVACSIAPYAEYMIASQETEPAAGWNYGFLKDLGKDESAEETGRRVVDAYFEGANEGQRGLTLACLDLSGAESVSNALNDFFSPIGRSMDEDTFVKLSSLRSASTDFGEVVRAVSNGYDLIDLGSLIENCREFGNPLNLLRALNRTVIYSRASEQGTSGLSVYHPLHNKKDYVEGWKEDYAELSFSSGYQRYLNAFGTLLTGGTLADWSGLWLKDEGFGPDRENLFSFQLKPDQLANFASAQLIVMGSVNSYSDAYEVQLSGNGAPERGNNGYYPVWTSEGQPDENGLLSFAYRGRSLYITDDSGQAIAGPVGYRLSDDGRELYVLITFQDRSGRDRPAPNAKVLFTCEEKGDGSLEIVNTEVYDRVSETYTRRIAFREEEYTDMFVDRLARSLPEDEEPLPGMEEWKEVYYDDIELSLPLSWHLRFFDEQLSGVPLFATLQITDVQQNSYCTPLVRVQNPNLMDISVSPRVYESPDFDLTVYAVMDTSPINPGLNIGFDLANRSLEQSTYTFRHFVLNNTRTAAPDSLNYPSIYGVKPGESGYTVCHIPIDALTGMGDITGLAFDIEVMPIEHYDQGFSRSVHTVLSGAQVPGTAALSQQILAVHEENGIRFELLEMERNHRSGLSVLLHAVNETDQTFLRYGNAIINDTIQTEDRIHIEVEPHTEQYCRLELNNRALLSHLLDVQDTENRQYLGIYHIFEQFGIRDVESLKLTLYLANLHNTVYFRLPTPVPFDSGSVQYAQTNQDAHLLLDDELQVWVNRVLVGSNGVGMVLTMHNASDRDLNLELCYAQINGHLSNSTTTEQYAVGAGASMIACTMISTWLEYRNEPVSDISLAFRYDSYTSRRAHIQLREPAPFGASGGIYLSPQDFDVLSVHHGSIGSVQVMPSVLNIADSEISMEIAATNRHDTYTAPEDYSFSTTDITVQFHIRNLSGNVLRYRLDDFCINDERLVSGLCFTMDVEPGEEKDIEEDLTLSELSNLAELHAFSARLEVKTRDGGTVSDQYLPVRFELSGCVISDNVPFYSSALAEAEQDGILYRLLSMEVRSDGNLRGVMHVRNQSDHLFSYDSAEILMDKVHTLGYVFFSNSFLTSELPPDHEKYVTFSWSNTADLSGTGFQLHGSAWRDSFYPGTLLQSLGIDEIHTMTLLLGANPYRSALDSTIPLQLTVPFALPEADRSLRDNQTNRVRVMDGPVRIDASLLMAGDNGVCISLMFTNTTEDLHVLTLTDPCLGTVPVRFREYEVPTRILLAPFSSYAMTAALLYPEGTPIPDMFGEPSFGVEENGEMLGRIRLQSDLPLLPGHGLIIDTPYLHAGQDTKDTSMSVSQFSAEPVFVQVHTETWNIRELEHAPQQASPSGENEAYAVALKLTNSGSAPVSLQICGLINGSFYTWDRFTLGEESSWICFCMDAYQWPSDYELRFFADGQEIYAGTLSGT